MNGKKKLALVAIAFLLVIGLVLGGTLMLWSSKSETATNTVTLDDCKIYLREAGGRVFRSTNNDGVYSPIPGYTTEYGKKRVGDDFKGYNWTAAEGRPGDWLEKIPDVENVGSIPVYVKVTGKFVLSPPEGANADKYQWWSELADLWTAVNNGDQDAQALLEQYFGDVIIDFNSDFWVADGPTAFAYNPDTNSVECYIDFYYAPDGVLKPLPPLGQAPNNITEDIFGGLNIPLNVPNLFHNFTYNLELTAYAIQSDNIVVDQTDLAAWIELFAGRGYGAYDISDLSNITAAADYVAPGPVSSDYQYVKIELFGRRWCPWQYYNGANAQWSYNGYELRQVEIFAEGTATPVSRDLPNASITVSSGDASKAQLVNNVYATPNLTNNSQSWVADNTTYGQAYQYSGDPDAPGPNNDDPAYIIFDLGAQYNITDVNLYWRYFYAEDIIVSGSNDGSTWTELGRGHNDRTNPADWTASGVGIDDQYTPDHTFIAVS